MNQIRLTPAFFLLVVALCCASGCGKGTGKTKIHGKVTWEGTPVPKGTIDFRPTDGKGQPSSGFIENGEYTADAPVGSVRVEVHYPKVVGQRRPFPNSPPEDKYEEQLPARFNTDSKLVKEITADTTQLDFELKSKE